MKKLLNLILVIFFTAGLSGCESSANAQIVELSENTVKGVIMPHHLIVSKNIEKLYAEIAASNNIERVIILSPNHFHYGFNFIQTTDRLDANLDARFISELSGQKGAFLEPEYFEEEHGVGVHLPYVKQYFKDARIVPVIMKKYTPHDRLEHLIDVILKQNLKNTLVIASIDFSHYAEEKFASEDDAKTMDWLKEWSKNKGATDVFKEIHKLAKSSYISNEEAVAIDSPESLYVLIRLMEAQGAYSFTFKERTSSAANFGVKDPLQNTSHIFGTFSI
jgi:AmmeMemoRadiSam system protein B